MMTWHVTIAPVVTGHQKQEIAMKRPRKRVAIEYECPVCSGTKRVRSPEQAAVAWNTSHPTR